VPDLVPAEKRTRAFGIFYTGTIGAGAIAPILYGLISDRIGLTGGVIVVGCLVALTLPLAFALRGAFAQPQSPTIV
jgi:MFS family permease